ncbi:MAG: GNAT family N-acetyltransferase [Odoribacter sp.]
MLNDSMEKKEEIMNLWRECFNDSEASMRLYFNSKYRDENALVYEENGQALSALQMIPYPMSWEGTMLSTSYISGVCTHPCARKRGLMKQLLKKAILKMSERNISVTTLIPASTWLYDYYAKFGYTKIFEFTEENYKPSKEKTTARISSPEKYDTGTEAFFPYFNHCMQARSCCIQHTAEDYTTIVQDVYESGGRLIATYEGNPERQSGLAFAVPCKEEVIVKELFFDHPSDREALFQEINRIWPNASIKYIIPPVGKSIQSIGMARIIQVEQLMKHFAQRHPNECLYLKITDPLLPANDAIHIIQGGRYWKINRDVKVIRYTELTINELTTLLLKQQRIKEQPYMSLMLD